MPSKFNPQGYLRHSIRLKGYDYASPGAYFITIVTYQRECLFGEIINGEMKLNKIGKSLNMHGMIWQTIIQILNQGHSSLCPIISMELLL